MCHCSGTLHGMEWHRFVCSGCATSGGGGTRTKEVKEIACLRKSHLSFVAEILTLIRAEHSGGDHVIVKWDFGNRCELAQPSSRSLDSVVTS